MYQSLPFTGAPIIYIALAVFFFVTGLIVRLWEFVAAKLAKEKIE